MSLDAPNTVNKTRQPKWKPASRSEGRRSGRLFIWMNELVST